MGVVTTRSAGENDLRIASVRQISDLINKAYDESEAGMWQQQGKRTDPTEVEHLLRTRSLVLAEIDGRLVGSVAVTFAGDGVGEFGMLSAGLDQRGKGVGSALVDHAEGWARANACHTMQLELLTPRHWLQPSKEFLKSWYARRGYKPQSTQPFETMYARLVPHLATECDFTVWRKPLSPTRDEAGCHSWRR